MIETTFLKEMFPVKANYLYFNYASDGPLPAPARDAICAAVKEKAEEGLMAVPKQIAVYENVRAELSILFDAAPECFAFTKNTSEGGLLALLAMDIKEDENYIVAGDAFPTTIRIMESHCKGAVRKVFINHDTPLTDQLKEITDHKTRAIVLDWVHYFSGKIIDLDGVVEFARSNNIFTVIDGIQGAGALELKLGGSGIDFFIAAGHKWMLSPQGAGFIYTSPEVWKRIPRKSFGWLGYNWRDFSDFDIDPDLREGNTVMEYGTRSYIAATGLYHCLKLINRVGIKNIEAHNRELRRVFLEKIIKKGYETLQNPAVKSASIIPFRFPGQDAGDLVKELAPRKVVVSLRNGYVRAALHWVNHMEEVERLIDLLP
jgi:selenocysteine lyase/cysteine desulfurase